MRVGICDDDVRWCQTAKAIIQEYGKKTDMETEILCFRQEEELNQEMVQTEDEVQISADEPVLIEE